VLNVREVAALAAEQRQKMAAATKIQASYKGHAARQNYTWSQLQREREVSTAGDA
jgi:chitodextrinase